MATTLEKPQTHQRIPRVVESDRTLREFPMHVIVNGTEQTVEPGLSIARLLIAMGKNPKYLAVERNGELVPRKLHGESVIQDGDQIEIVTLVGGG